MRTTLKLTAAVMTLAGLLLVMGLGADVPAQEKSFKDMITGAWLITSVFDEYQNGEKKGNWAVRSKARSHLAEPGDLHKSLSDHPWLQ
jgi:hypothetical protein